MEKMTVLNPRKIALVDDDKDIIGTYELAVKRLGYEKVFVAYDGVEIVEAVITLECEPDVILMDQHMPRMTGLQAAACIQIFNPDIRIIIATADYSAVEQARTMGRETIEKPFTISKLQAVLEHPAKEALAA